MLSISDLIAGELARENRNDLEDEGRVLATVRALIDAAQHPDVVLSLRDVRTAAQLDGSRFDEAVIRLADSHRLVLLEALLYESLLMTDRSREEYYVRETRGRWGVIYYGGVMLGR